MSTSDQVKLIIKNNLTKIFNLPPDREEEIKPLIYFVMLCVLNQTYNGIEETPLNGWVYHKLKENISNYDIDKILFKENSNQLLMDRWDVVDSVLLDEAVTDIDQEGIYKIALPLFTKKVSFGPLPTGMDFLGNPEHYPIVNLRQNTRLYHDLTRVMSSRLDSSEYAIERDHACLSSFCLMYTLSLFKAIIFHSHVLKASPMKIELLKLVDTLIKDLSALFLDKTHQWIYEGSEVV
jgi:hypothetical protein